MNEYFKEKMKKVDIHNHILWGIDDGAYNKKESIQMLQAAAEDGITDIIATPHFHKHKGYAEPQKIEKLLNEVKEIAEEKNISINLYTGNELYYTYDLLKQVIEKECFTLAKSRYVLLEFSVSEEKRKIQKAVYEFRGEGYFPIIAHVERYEAFANNIEALQEIINMGALLQVNAGVTSDFSKWWKKKFEKSILKKGLVNFLATDAHDMQKRKPQFKKNEQWLRKKYGDEEIKKMLYINPKKILENTDWEK